MADEEEKQRKFRMRSPRDNKLFTITADSEEQARNAFREYDTKRDIATDPKAPVVTTPKSVEEGRVYTDAEKEEIREGVTLGRAARAPLRGAARQVEGIVNLPATLTGLMDDPNEPFPYSAPRVQDLADAVVPGAAEAVDTALQPEFSEAEKAVSPLAAIASGAETGAEWAGAPTATAFRRGGRALKNAAKDDAILFTGTGLGEYAGGTAGELGTGGVISIIQAMRTGNYSNLTREESDALEFIFSTAPAEKSRDEIIQEVEWALSQGQAGSLSEVAQLRGFRRTEDTMAGIDSQFGDKLDDARSTGERTATSNLTVPLRADAAGNQRKIRPRATAGGPLETDAATKQVDKIYEAEKENIMGLAEAARAERQAAAAAGRQDRLDAGEAPDLEGLGAAREEATVGLEGARQRVADAEEADRLAKSNYEQLRPEQFRKTVPGKYREDVFEGVDYDDDKYLFDLQERMENYWKVDAFQEVKGKEKFILPDEFSERVAKNLDTSDIRTAFKNYYGDVLERVRRARGIEMPEGMDELEMEDFIREVTSGEVSGETLMALRNFFARRANRTTDEVAREAATATKNEFDRIIKGQLTGADLQAFKEGIDVYPTYLSQSRLMDNPQVRLDLGEYNELDRMKAQQRQDFPDEAQDIDSYQAKQRASGELEEARAQQKVAQARWDEATKAETAGQIQHDQRVLESGQSQNWYDDKLLEADNKYKDDLAEGMRGLNRTVIAKYRENPSKFIKSELKDSSRNNRLREVYDALDEDGRAALRLQVAREVQDMFSDTKGWLKNTQARDAEIMVNNLTNAGLISGPQGREMANIIAEATQRRVAQNVRRGELPDLKTKTAIQSSILAALMMNAAPGSSLILAGVAKRVTQSWLRGKYGEQEIIQALQEMHLQPQKFLKAAQTAQSETAAVDKIVTMLRTASGVSNVEREFEEE